MFRNNKYWLVFYFSLNINNANEKWLPCRSLLSIFLCTLTLLILYPQVSCLQPLQAKDYLNIFSVEVKLLWYFNEFSVSYSIVCLCINFETLVYIFPHSFLFVLPLMKTAFLFFHCLEQFYVGDSRQDIDCNVRKSYIFCWRSSFSLANGCAGVIRWWENWLSNRQTELKLYEFISFDLAMV